MAREELWILGEVAGEAAHELRNALAVIAGSATLIRSANVDGQLETHVAKIERSTRIAQGVVDGLMALARGEAVRPDAPMVALAWAIAEGRKDVPQGATFTHDAPPDLAVRGNEVLLSRIFRVLYENAIQAGAKNIDTRVTRGSEVVVDVVDDGEGVSEAVRATLFEPLVTTKAHGTGLGLALVRRVARAHGGDAVLVPSAAGAHFRITLRA